MTDVAHMVAINMGSSRQNCVTSPEINRVTGTLTIIPEAKKNDFLLKLVSEGRKMREVPPAAYESPLGHIRYII